jgi:hypothetical protein
METTMDRSVQTLPDPGAAPRQDRRRTIRQKLHSPVYASFNTPETGTVVDLSELLDLNEDGFAVQTAEKLEVNRAVTLCLELPETRSYVHATGQVVWSDETGRGGVRFGELTDESRRTLKQWLLANLLIGSANHAARKEQLVRQQREKESEQEREQSSGTMAAPEPSNVALEGVPIVQQEIVQPKIVQQKTETDVLAELESMRAEIRNPGTDIDAVLQLITARALHLTGANGAALAFLSDDRMVCRGRAGEPAPPIGAPVDVRYGLTGECVRSGVLVSCEDMENDPRVDPEVGRQLGIGSLMAAPILFDFRVVGLLEIFSSRPRGFSKTHKTILHRLVEMIPNACLRTSQRRETQPQELTSMRVSPVPSLNEPAADALSNAKPFVESELAKQAVKPNPQPANFGQAAQQRLDTSDVATQDTEAEPSTSSRLLFRALIGLSIVIVATVLGYLIGPAMERRWAASARPSPPVVKVAEAASQTAAPVHRVRTLADLQKLAEQGDADAQWQLGVRYHNGEEVPRDDAQAVLWFFRAAEQGHSTAQATLGAYYWAGRGVPQDLTKAYFWSALALAQGDENSRSRLEGLASQMTKSQVASARQQAELWLHAHNEQAKSNAN